MYGDATLISEYRPRIAAQQIAFMRLGEKYCAHYYHQPRAWGISRDTLALHGSRHNHYARLPYVLYYKHYVAPLSKRLYPTLSKKDWQKICWHLPPMDNQRDPLQDAKRLIWQRYHRQHCGTLEQRDYMSTAQFCLRYVRYTCPNDQHCDAVERCKLTPGILFTNTF